MHIKQLCSVIWVWANGFNLQMLAFLCWLQPRYTQ